MLVRLSAIAGLFATTQQITRMSITLAPRGTRSPEFSFPRSKDALVAGIFAQPMNSHRTKLIGQCLETPSNARVRVDIVATGSLDVPAGFVKELGLGSGCCAFLLAETRRTRQLSQGGWRKKMQMPWWFQGHPVR